MSEIYYFGRRRLRLRKLLLKCLSNSKKLFTPLAISSGFIFLVSGQRFEPYYGKTAKYMDIWSHLNKLCRYMKNSLAYFTSN